MQTSQASEMDERDVAESMQKLLVIMGRLDQKIAPMLEADGSYFNSRWIHLPQFSTRSICLISLWSQNFCC